MKTHFRRGALGLAVLLAMASSGVAVDAQAQLAAAVREGDSAVVAALLRQRADVNAPLADGTTALMWAVYADDFGMVQRLLAAGADAKVASQRGLTALSMAVENGNTRVIEALVAAGADVNAAPAGDTPLHVAARTGVLETARLLLARGAHVNARERWQGETPLMLAANENHAPMVRLLVESGADVNATANVSNLLQGPGQASQTFVQIPNGGLTALMLAAREGAMESARALIDGGANVDYQDRVGVTPMLVALHNGHFQMAALLIERGADVNDGSLYMAVEAHNLVMNDVRPIPPAPDGIDSVEIVRRLLSRGADPNLPLTKEMQSRTIGFSRPRMISGLTPMQRAAEAADVTVLRLLLDAGADPRRRGVDGNTALLSAVRSFGGGGRFGLAYRSRTPGDTLEAVALLLQKGADPNAANFAGMTPLHLAAQQSANALIEVFVAAGARLDARNDADDTPLDLAPEAGGARGGRGAGAADGGNEESAAALLRRLMTAAGISTPAAK